MSNWRNDEGKQDQHRDARKPKSSPLPVIARKETPPLPPKKDWRGRAINVNRQETAKLGDRSWTGSHSSSAPSIGPLLKYAVAGVIGLAVLGLFVGLWKFLFDNPPKLPVIISIAGSHSILDIGENPFGKQALDWLAVSNKDIVLGNLNLVSNNDKSDTFLRELKTKKDWIETGSVQPQLDSRTIRSGKMGGGGPNKNVACYFLSGHVVRAQSNSSEPWVLLCKDDDPYSSSNVAGPADQVRGIGIKTVLERIGEQTHDNSYAWVVFDMCPPSVVTNVCDLEFPYQAFDEAFQGLSEPLKDRIIVTLPCSEGQESWLAPEYSCSLFAYQFWRGLAMGFDMPDGPIDLERFEEKLKNEVNSWAALHRHASQTPTFLMSDRSKTSKKKILLFSTERNKSNSFVSPSFDADIKTRLDRLDDLWDRFDKLGHTSQSNPMEYTSLEAQLIAMEDLAETGSANWTKLSDNAVKSIKKLEEAPRFDRRVSLIESLQHIAAPWYARRVSNSEIFSQELLKELDSTVKPEWMMNPPFWSSTPPAPSSKLARDDCCLKVWTVLQQNALLDDRGVWERTFTPERLTMCLSYLPAKSDGETRAEWLEIQLIKILRDAVANDSLSETAKTASVASVAKAIRTYSLLTKAGTYPNPELSRWTKNELLELERLYFIGLDALVANQFDLCNSTLTGVSTRVDAIRNQVETLSHAMQFRDSTLRLAPHLLAAWMRETRYASENQSDLRSNARELAKLVTQAHRARDILADPSQNIASLVRLSESLSTLQILVDGTQNTFSNFEKDQQGDPESNRKCRTALRWPMLDIQLRKRFHQQLASFYLKSDERTTKPSSTITHLAPSKLVEYFLTCLDDIKVQESYREWLERDPRISSMPRMMQIADTVPLYANCYAVRSIGSSVGQRAIADPLTSERWPWNAAQQFYAQNLNAYCELQIARINQAHWGDRELAETQVDGKYYFERLAEPYEILNRKVKSTAALDWKVSFVTNAHTETIRLHQDFSRLNLTANAEESEDDLPSQITLSGTFGTNDSSGVRVAGRTGPTEAFELNKQNHRLRLSINPMVDESLLLSHRGHTRRIGIPKPQSTDKIQFVREKRQTPTIKVQAAKTEPVTLLILLDCSASMIYEGIHSKAIETVKSLLRRVGDLSQRGENQIEVGLIVFGRKEKGNPPLGFNRSRQSSEIFYSEIRPSSDVDSILRLANSDWIIPSGCTPLYHAIGEACDMAERRMGRARIVVVSDGGNNTDSNEYSYTGTVLGPEQVKNKLKKSLASLYVYQYDNNGEFPTEQSVKDELMGIINSDANQAGKGRASQVFYQDFAAMTKAIEESLPFSTVTIEAGGKNIGHKRFGEDIEVPGDYPMAVEVQVESMGLKANNNLWLEGSEQIELEYQSNTNRLGFIDFERSPGARNKGFTFPNKTQQFLSISQPRWESSTLTQQTVFFNLAIRPDITSQVEPKFTRRPKFVVAEMRPIANTDGDSILISDFDYEPRTHYPILKTGSIKLTQMEWESNQMDFKIWFSSETPNFGRTIRLDDKQTDSVLEDTATGRGVAIERNGTRISARIDSNLADRYFVVCWTAEKSTRFLSGRNERRVEFQVDENHRGPVEIQVISLRSLQQAANSGDIGFFAFEPQTFRK
jgi:hypothetical protein